jgi:endonuclease I
VLIYDILYTDDMELVALSEEALQIMLDTYAEVMGYCGMEISHKKTKVMVYGPSPGVRVRVGLARVGLVEYEKVVSDEINGCLYRYYSVLRLKLTVNSYFNYIQ